jgi:hypothetical protein
MRIRQKLAVIALVTLPLYVLLAGALVVPVQAQAPCGMVNGIGYPVDPAVFQIVQDFGAPSPRHGGRYHTGEDWYGGLDSYGQPVRAIAVGRVMYSWPLGWGRDGGVVILEHTFPDGSIAYSQYGHMEETEQYPFPGKFACVQQGDVVGVVGNARPAPHVHFEIRVNQPDVPGPGYTWEDPTTLGWRRPSQFVLNWQAWLHPAHRWHLTLLDEAGPISPPLLLPDYGMLYLDAYRLRGITPDGRILWRANFDKPAAGVTPFQDKVLVTFADGTMQRVNLDGTLADSWETGVAVDSAPISIGSALVFHTPDERIVVFDDSRRVVLWQIDGVPPIRYSRVAGRVIGLMTDANELLTVSLQGQLIDRRPLQGLAGLETAPDGTLLVYSQDGLWTVSEEGTWTPMMENLPPGADSNAVLLTGDGTLYVLSGDAVANISTLYAYDANGQRWAVSLPYMPGLTELADYGSAILLTGNHGHIIAIQPSSGGICGLARIYGSRRANVWHRLGDDGILRVAVADQVLGLDWQTFLGGCA